MKKIIIKVTSLILLFVLPFCIFLTVAELLPSQNGNTYLAELNDKYDRLKNEGDKKIVFVGGSSLPFGLRSDIIEEQLDDYKVINFGLYATLGTKFMMDLSKVNIKQGDIIILTPELNEQTYSLYFNPDAVLQACDGLSKKYKHLSSKENMQLAYNYYKYAFDKIKYFTKKSAPDPIGIYRHDSFNEYGDISVDRPNNIMNNGVDSTMGVYTDGRLLNDEFIDYVNEYCRYVRKQKAKIYFNFCPVNELSLKSSKDMRQWFTTQLNERLECDLLMDIEDCIIDYRYFYDTNFHLNSSGAVYYSSMLVKAIENKINPSISNGSAGSGDSSSEEGGVQIPAPPKPPESVPIDPPPVLNVAFEDYNGELNVDYADWFIYRKSGEKNYTITGVKREHYDMEEVILPSVYNGCYVTSITEDALSNCVELKRVHIGETYKALEGFYGCISLERIYLYAMDGNHINVPKESLLNGAARNVKIYVPKGSNYFDGYTWSNYGSNFVEFTKGD